VENNKKLKNKPMVKRKRNLEGTIITTGSPTTNASTKNIKDKMRAMKEF